MSLITREGKGSKLTIQEMDGNLLYLQSLSGSTGQSGTSGTSGDQGVSGTSGTSGQNGTNGSSGGGVTNVTYNQLTGLTSTSGLTVGGLYLITDYQTVHTIPYTGVTNSGTIEPLLVTASGVNTLNPIAYSSLYPKDIIYYDYNNRQDMVPGCTKGYIYRRIDTLQNNDIPFDFRNVKFRRWQISVTNSWIGTTNYGINNVVKLGATNIYISLVNNSLNFRPGPGAPWALIDVNNLTYASPTPNNYIVGQSTIPCTALFTDYNMFPTYNSTIHDNIIGQDYLADGNILSSNNTVFIGTSVFNNKIGGNFSNNTMTYNTSYSSNVNFNNNTILNGFSNNIIGNSFNFNSINNNFNLNVICKTFTNNSISNGFNTNVISNNFNNNLISYNFSTNLIDISFGFNNIAIGFQNNQISSEFVANNIGPNFTSNILSPNFAGNKIGNSFSSNTTGSVFMNNVIGNSFSGNIFGGSDVTTTNICDSFNANSGMDFTSATYIYNTYSKELFIDSNNQQKLIYDKITIVDANA